MGYKHEGTLADDLFSAEFVPDTAKAITEEVGKRWRAGVAKRTPVARPPEAYHADFADWIKDRGGRPPRTMRDSWTVTDVIKAGDDLYRVEIYSREKPINSEGRQVADFVEEDTRPHLIRARKAQALRFPSGPIFRYAKEVWHPGTQGIHMMRDSGAEIDIAWEQFAGPIVQAKEDEYNAR